MSKLLDVLTWAVVAAMIATLIPVGTKTTVTREGSAPGGFVKTSTKVENETLWTIMRDWLRTQP